ncbi:MAG TPA: helix-turn-helix transcriptional regulator [Pseudomonadales bacterium]|nr:helix-turn-helix transcriptional regulator [Pseudomonadales bacterium]
MEMKLITRKVRNLLADSSDAYPSLEIAAKMLGMSGRTLRRRLLSAGTTFQAELDAVRKEFAISLLEEKPITQIATLLGFNDTSAFSRAFKRWTGVTPSQYLKIKNNQSHAEIGNMTDLIINNAGFRQEISRGFEQLSG